MLNTHEKLPILGHCKRFYDGIGLRYLNGTLGSVLKLHCHRHYANSPFCNLDLRGRGNLEQTDGRKEGKICQDGQTDGWTGRAERVQTGPLTSRTSGRV